MEKYIKNYLEHFNLMIHEVECEVCGAEATDIHHIIFRSHFGKKRKDEQDNVQNLIGLCRECHDRAHGKGNQEKFTVEYLQEIHLNNLRYT